MMRNELRHQVASLSSSLPFDGFGSVASILHFWQMYLRQSLQRFVLVHGIIPNFSPQSAHEQTQAPLEHRLPQPRLSFDLVKVTMFRFRFSSLSTILPIRSCSDRSTASALRITCENIRGLGPGQKDERFERIVPSGSKRRDLSLGSLEISNENDD